MTRRLVTGACIGMLWAAYAGGAAAEQRDATPAQSNRSTYIGCLRAQDDGTYRLTEVGGPDVPESRSWRSMFMTAERVLVVDAPQGVDMAGHAGQTVRVTGERDGKTLHARTVTFVGATCK